MSRILVTGASGFIGRSLVAELARSGHGVRAAVRAATSPFPSQVETVPQPDLATPLDWQPMLAGIDAVIHLAGIAHAGPGIPERLYDRVNRAATAELAQAATQAGVARFIVVSSIRAQSGPSADHVLTENDAALPTDAYGRSKLAAETAVRATGIPFTIFRPVLVYGPGAKGNLAGLLRLTASPWPLPFAAFRNRRSLLGLDNLVAALAFALRSPAAAGETYVVADPEPLAIRDIIACLREAQRRPPRLLPVPPACFELPLRLLGRGDLWDRLGGKLCVDPGKLLAAGWRPPVATRAGLAAMAQAASPRKSGTASRNTR